MTLQAPAHAQPTLDERRIRRWLRTWAREWNDPGLAQEATLEVSPRLTRSLGKAYPQRTLIRLNPSLLDPKDDRRLKEVACHEAAHLAVYRRFGKAARPHGPEWRHLIELAGFEPATTFKAETREGGDPRPALWFVHTCPVCGTQRRAKKPMPSWRCMPCREEGREGRLRITTEPRRGPA